MSENEELVYGLKMRIKKGINYINDLSLNELCKDELRLDAVSYCLVEIASISKKISSINEINNKYEELDFYELSKVYDDCFKEDNFNLTHLYNLFKEAFPIVLEILDQ